MGIRASKGNGSVFVQYGAGSCRRHAARSTSSTTTDDCSQPIWVGIMEALEVKTLCLKKHVKTFQKTRHL